jgi:hypothetical protein
LTKIGLRGVRRVRRSKAGYANRINRNSEVTAMASPAIS